MFTKLLATAAMAAATWLAWRLIANLTAAAARKAATSDDRSRDDGRTISMEKDPETGTYRAREETRER